MSDENDSLNDQHADWDADHHLNRRPAPLPNRPLNNGFWDRAVEERSARMDAVCERGGVCNFFDLPAEERAAAYDRE